MAQRPRDLLPELSDEHQLGAHLRDLRERRGLSQSKLGELVYCSGHLIGKIEKAERRAQADLTKRCDDILDAAGTLVALLPAHPSGTLRQGSADAASEPRSDRRRLQQTSPAAEIDIIEAARTRYEVMYRHVGGIAVRPRIEAFLKQHVAPAVRASYDNETGNRLRRATATLTAVAGICAYDAEEHRAARTHFTRALHLADASGDVALSGYVSALMANQALSLNDHHRALMHTERALVSGKSRLSAALRTDLHAMQAKAHAQLGDADRCQDQMRSATRCSELIISGDEPVETSYVHPGLVELKTAEALLQIGDLREAQTLAQAALQFGGRDPRSSFYSYATLALILAARREAEEAAAWANMALDASTGMESWRVRRHLDLVDQSFDPVADDQGVQAFRERVKRTRVIPF